MSGWSIEALPDGVYGLVLTKGQESRTVYQAFTAGDAAQFLAMAEIYELVQGGAPVEAFAKKKRNPRATRGRLNTAGVEHA